MHFHAYKMAVGNGGGHSLTLAKRLSTDCAGVAKALGLQNEAKVELEVFVNAIEQRITNLTRFDFAQLPPAIKVDPEE